MFADDFIEHRDQLEAADFERAEAFVKGGMPRMDALNYLRGWAQDYAAERHADSQAAAAFEDAAYGRD